MAALRTLRLVSALAAVAVPTATARILIVRDSGVAEYVVKDVQSQFGPGPGMLGMGGYLIAGDPEDGCARMAGPPARHPNNSLVWFVLLSDGNCSSTQKVLHAQMAGFQLAIVHSVDSDKIAPMTGDIDVDIPSYYIGVSDGIILKVNFLYGSGYYLSVPTNFPYAFLAYIVPAMLLIMFCILVLLAIMCCRCVSEHRRNRRRRLPKRVLNAIPTLCFAAGQSRYDTCAICLCDYADGDRLRVLPCRHAFHTACVDPWLTGSRRTCPVCKRRLVSATVAVLAEDSEDDSLLQVWRGSGAPTGRRYGATATTPSRTGRPPVPAPAETRQVDERPRQTRASRRARRTARRQARPAACSLPTGRSLVTTADDAPLLAEEELPQHASPCHSLGNLDVAASVYSPMSDCEAVVAPRSGNSQQLRVDAYAGLLGSTELIDDDCARPAGASAAAGRSAAEGSEGRGSADPPQPAAREADLVDLGEGDAERQQSAAPAGEDATGAGAGVV